jgi:L,D-transpeptidase ErfK/SrfK
MRVSHGCIRLYPENISSFFNEVETGIPVRIIDKPYKAGWLDGELYVQVHPPLAEYVEERGHNQTELVNAVISKLMEDNRRPDWKQLQNYAEQKTGMPMLLYLMKGNEVADNH